MKPVTPSFSPPCTNVWNVCPSTPCHKEKLTRYRVDLECLQRQTGHCSYLTWKPQGRNVNRKSVFMTNQPQIPKNPINACSFLSVDSLNPQVLSFCSTSSRSDENLCLLVYVHFQVFIIKETNSSEPATSISPNRLSGYWIKLNNAYESTLLYIMLWR